MIERPAQKLSLKNNPFARYNIIFFKIIGSYIKIRSFADSEPKLSLIYSINSNKIISTIT